MLLHRDREQATLRMSLQVRVTPDLDPQVGYFGEMFLTRRGHQEEFVGFIQTYLVDRRSNEDWEDVYLSDWAIKEYGGTGLSDTLRFMQGLFNITFHSDEGDKDPYEYEYPTVQAVATRTENAMLLPAVQYRNHFAAAWTRISDDTTDILYIPLIWIRSQVRESLSHSQPTLFKLPKMERREKKPKHSTGRVFP